MIKWLVILFIILLVLAYFGLNLRALVNSTTFQDNWNFLSGVASNIWNDHIKGALTWLWNTVFVPLVIKPGVKSAIDSLTSTSTLQGQ